MPRKYGQKAEQACNCGQGFCLYQPSRESGPKLQYPVLLLFVQFRSIPPVIPSSERAVPNRLPLST